MGFATFSGPVRVGTVRENAGRNTGLVTLTQAVDTGVVTAGVGNVDFALGILPQGAQIINILVDQVVVPGGSSTSTISVGTTTGGADLLPAIATTAGGRFTGVLTAATQLAWQTSTTADTPISVRYAVGSAAGVGRAIITVAYVQRAPNGTRNPISA
jgi:hypothetical protein